MLTNAKVSLFGWKNRYNNLEINFTFTSPFRNKALLIKKIMQGDVKHAEKMPGTGNADGMDGRKKFKILQLLWFDDALNGWFFID